MKFLFSLLALSYVGSISSVPSLPLHPGGIGGLFKGPNSEIIIKGPDGSIITAANEGGEVHTKLEPIIVPEPEIILSQPEVIVPVIESVAVPSPPVENKQNTDLIGPSGRIATSGSKALIAGPASTTISDSTAQGTTIIKTGSVVDVPVVNAEVPVLLPVPQDAIPVVAVTASPILVDPRPTATFAGGVLTATGAPTVISINDGINLVPDQIATDNIQPVISSNPASNIVPPVIHVTPQAVVPPLINVTPRIPTGNILPSGAVPGSIVPPVVTVPPPSERYIPTAGNFAPPVVTVSSTPSGGYLPTGGSIVPPVTVPSVPAGGYLPTRGNIVPPVVTVPSTPSGGNIIPPPVPSGRYLPTPGTLLTTPGLGTVGSTSNILRQEELSGPVVTPKTVQVLPQPVVPPQVIGLQNQQNLLNSQIQYAEDAEPILLPQNPIRVDSRVALQNPANGGNNILFTPAVNAVDGKLSLVNSGQNLLELANPQIQLTNVPLASVNAKNIVSWNKGSINSGLGVEAWGRYGRDTEKDKN